MGVPYDIFTNAFLSKISEYDFIKLEEKDRTNIVDGYMKRALTGLKHVCEYDFSSYEDDKIREYGFEVNSGDIDELAEIISEGMLVQWLKPYVYKQEILENVLNTKDYTTYSPSELLLRIGNAYNDAKKNYTQLIREYSYNHGDLSDLHL